MKCLGFSSSLVLGLLLTLGSTSPAGAQASRTWISGVGDDGNSVSDCSRSTPCKTFAGAISVTASGGEIDCLDPGGFGALTIAKPITIDCGAGVGSILVSGTNGITINSAGATDAITIRNLTFEGLGTGLSGISILAGNTVHLENIKIHDFTTAGVLVNAAAAVNLTMNNVTVTADNATGSGVSITTSAGVATAELENVRIWNTHPAIQGKANSVWTVHDSDLSFNGVGAKALTAGSVINLINCQLNNNLIAVQSVAGSTINVINSTMSQNGTALNPDGGNIISNGNNSVSGNASNGDSTGSSTQL
jgi:hypothetical protein